jgi:hypothetical protein
MMAWSEPIIWTSCRRIERSRWGEETSARNRYLIKFNPGLPWAGISPK